MDLIAFFQGLFLPSVSLFLAVTLIVYIFLKIFVGDKIGKDVIILLSASLAFLVVMSTMASEFLKSVIQFGITLLIVIFLGVLIFGAFIGMGEVKKFFTWKPFVGIIGVTLFLAVIIYMGTYLSTPQQASTQTQTALNQTTSNGTSQYTTVTGRPLSPMERVIFNPSVLFTVLFFLFFAAVAYIIGRE